MLELFSDIFACRDNALRRIDPRAKLAVAITIILATVTAQRPLFPVLMLVCCLTTLLALKMPVRIIALRMTIPMSIVSVLVILNAFMTGTHVLYSFLLFDFPLEITTDGLWQGVLMGSRVLGAVSAILVLSFATPTHDIFRALRWLGISRDWVEVALLMYRHIFTLLDQATDMEAAQRVRLGYSGVRRSLSSMGALVGSVLIRSLDQGMRTHEAMQVRGYHGHMPYGPMPRMNTLDRSFAILGTLTVLTAYALLEWR